MMKTIQSFRNLAISNFEMQHLKGGKLDGTPVSGSFSVLGSAYSYSGDMSLTADNNTSVGIGVVTTTTTTYVSDFCGSASFDGTPTSGCAQYINGHWVIV
jgi:hypothetical protein